MTPVLTAGYRVVLQGCIVCPPESLKTRGRPDLYESCQAPEIPSKKVGNPVVVPQRQRDHMGGFYAMGQQLRILPFPHPAVPTRWEKLDRWSPADLVDGSRAI